MPASTEKQKHFMQMALAIKHGHTISGLSKETSAALHKAARSMSESQISDFARVAKRKKNASS